MNELVLTLRERPAERFDASPLDPHRLASLSIAEIEQLSLHLEGGNNVRLGDFCTVKGSPSHSVRLIGDFSTADALGANMTGGRLAIEGNVGRRLGERMLGGVIDVAGNVSDDTGLEMAGGTIVIHGSAGRRTGAAAPGAKRGMTGGEIVIFGNAGEQTGACMRRGVIAVGGDVGPGVLHTAIAGTVIALGDVATPAARWSKRASLIVLGEVAIPPTYRYACTYQPSFLRVLFTHLRRTYGFPAGSEQAAGHYRRYAGDFAESGRGEILHWTGE